MAYYWQYYVQYTYFIMTRPVVLIIEVLVLLALLRTPFVQYFLADTQESVSQWMLEVSSYVENQKMDEFKQQLHPLSVNMQDYQKSYLDQITNSRGELTQFNRAYCIEGDKNPYIYGTSLRLLCQQIDQSGLLEY